MPSVIGRHELTLVPEYRVVSLRDAQRGGLEGSSEAIAEAGRTVAASAPSGLYLSVSQDQLPVRLELVIWDGPPTTGPGPGTEPTLDWTPVGRFVMPFPSGEVALGDLGGKAVSGPWLRGRTGDYTVEVWSRGRDEAAARQAQMFAETADLTIPQARAYIEREGSGIEQYQLWLWPHTPVT
ncbi:hypothetical protein [Actinoplanes sp. NPDC026623]|uniref:hypothetical protein n=1 Tax=Actinoplanes sp. NPDC026623 TaxID=3155610 RepID=UPI0033ED4E31